MKLTSLLAQRAPLLTDGAMGTYFAKLSGGSIGACELANTQNPKLIRRIHEEYVAAGAGLLRTNTFSANTKSLELPLPDLLENVKAGYRLAMDAARGKALVAADMTSIYSGEEDFDPLPEYLAIADAFLEEGAELFLFETLAALAPFDRVARYIKEKKPGAEIMVSFTVSPEGVTHMGIPLSRLIEDVGKEKALFSAVGLNCGCGPTHLLRFAKEVLEASGRRFGLPVMALPNAGYPAMEERRMVFDTSPEYFAQRTSEIASLGISLIGGCCGTTPEHILRLSEKLTVKKPGPVVTVSTPKAPKPQGREQPGRFEQKLMSGGFVTAAELDPPYGTDLTKLLSAAREFQEAGVDIVTISDSPMARVKLDPVVCGAKIQRETGMEVLPHLCCRDRNVNALRAMLLGAQCEKIRAVLAVTGDPVPELDRGYIKPVFNLTSAKLIETVRRMNRDLFSESPFLIGGAFNPNAANPRAELSRLEKKMEAGARFFLTQPVFDGCCACVIDEARRMGAKVLVGIMPLVSFRNAVYMSNEVPGIRIPAEYAGRFSAEMSRQDAEETGIAIAAQIAGELRSHADGFYLVTPFNRAGVVCQVLKRVLSPR